MTAHQCRCEKIDRDGDLGTGIVTERADQGPTLSTLPVIFFTAASSISPYLAAKAFFIALTTMSAWASVAAKTSVFPAPGSDSIDVLRHSSKRPGRIQALRPAC